MNAATLPQWPDALESKLDGDGKSLTVYSSRPARTLFEIMKWLDQQGMQLEDVHLKRPTLEDVFVELTGKKLRDYSRASALCIQPDRHRPVPQDGRARRRNKSEHEAISGHHRNGH